MGLISRSSEAITMVLDVVRAVNKFSFGIGPQVRCVDRSKKAFKDDKIVVFFVEFLLDSGMYFGAFETRQVVRFLPE